MNLPSNWQKCEDEHFKHHDPYSDVGICPNCDEEVEELNTCIYCKEEYCNACEKAYDCPSCGV